MENVDVSNFSINENRLFTFFQARLFFLRENSVYFGVWRSVSHFESSPEMCICNARSVKIDYPQFFIKRQIFHSHTADPRDIPGWSLASIFNKDIHPERFIFLNPNNCCLHHIDVGTQLASSVADHNYNRNYKSDGLNKGRDGDQVSSDFGTAITRRFFFMLYFGLGSFLLSVWAGSNLDDKWRIIRAALVGIGLLGLLGSFGLLWATQFQTTWAWLL